MKLYKGRYLFAVYDENDYITAIYDNMSELVKHHLRSNKAIHLIDCIEKHNDCFSEEDRIFLEEFQNENSNKQDKMKEMGVSSSTYYRKRARLREAENEL